ncbi:MAG: hypothetical protein ACLP7Q_21940 [Isosphaeraceae bacterium]
MVGIEAFRRGLRRLATAVTLAMAIASAAHAQTPPLPNPSAPVDFAAVAGGPETFSPADTQPAGTAPSYYAGEGSEPTAPRMEMSLWDTITDSLFGDVYAPGRWRPLPLRTFFSEGWLEPWAGAPAGKDDLTPRHGWLGAFDGVFYRLWLTTFTYSHNLNKPYHGDQYSGLYQIFLPFSRRFEILMNVPFVVSNGTVSPNHAYTHEFGDLLISPRVLLSETAATTQLFSLNINVPTGTPGTGNGIMALRPRYEFWTNPGGPWVVRGGSSFFVPMNNNYSHSHTAYDGDLAIGRYFRPHDVPIGDLVLYAAANWSIPLDGTTKANTYFGVGPGTRFHIAKNFFFLHYWEFPLVGPHPYTYTMSTALLKVF